MERHKKLAVSRIVGDGEAVGVQVENCRAICGVSARGPTSGYGHGVSQKVDEVHWVWQIDLMKSCPGNVSSLNWFILLVALAAMIAIQQNSGCNVIQADLQERLPLMCQPTKRQWGFFVRRDR